MLSIFMIISFVLNIFVTILGSIRDNLFEDFEPTIDIGGKHFTIHRLHSNYFLTIRQQY